MGLQRSTAFVLSLIGRCWKVTNTKMTDLFHQTTLATVQRRCGRGT